MSGDIYQDRMLALADSAGPGGRLEAPDASMTLDNPLCGDRVALDIRRDPGGRVVALGHEVRGCVLCRAATAVLCAAAIGATATDLAAVRDALHARLRGRGALPDAPAWRELVVFEPVAAHKSRHACVLLPFDAALRALHDA